MGLNSGFKGLMHCATRVRMLRVISYFHFYFCEQQHPKFFSCIHLSVVNSALHPTPETDPQSFSNLMHEILYWNVYVLGGLYALAFLARGELWRHRIRNWYVYRVSRDIERSFSKNNDPAISTRRGDTCIDAVFTRHVEHLQTMNFVSYFSYHKPLLSITAQRHSVTCDDIPV